LVHPGYVIPDLGYGISRPTVLSNTDAPDIIALAAAYESYIRRGDLQRAGRCAQELYEIMRHWSADKETEYWRTAAAMMFGFAELPDRLAALQKSKEQEELLSSPFFYRAFGPGGSTSVAGSIEYVTMAQETNVTMVKKTNVFPKNAPSGSSNQAGLDWFQIDQKVLFKNNSDTGVIVGYHGGDLVSVKVDSGPDAGGSGIVLISWDEIEKLPTTES
jgi:hypothetical protein